MEYLQQILMTAGIVVGALLIVLIAIFSTWKKVPADKAAIVTGLGKAKVITGGGVVVIPVLQRIDYITLENISFDVNMQGTLTADAVPIQANGTVVVKIKNDDAMIRSAVEQFNCGNAEETKLHIMETARDVCEGRLREIIADMTAEQLYKDRKTFSERVKEVAEEQLSELGLELKSFTIKGIGDQNGYFEALSKPQIAAVKRDAEIAEAEALKESMVKTSEAKRAGEQARLEAEARMAESKKEADIKKLNYERERQTTQAISDAAYSIQQNVTQKEITNAEMDASVLKEQRAKEVREAEIQIQIVAEQKNIELAKRKAERKEAELLETVVKPSEAQKMKALLEAEAHKIAMIKQAEAEAEAKKLDAAAQAEAKKLDAEAQAERIKQEGMAQAEITQRQGLAQAEAVRKMGLAEAEALEKKAEALAKMDDAGKLQMVIEKLPEIARAVADPMSKIGNITIIGGGSGEGDGGAADVARYTVGSLKAVNEALKDTIGFDMTEVMRANTFEGKTTRNIKMDVTTPDGKGIALTGGEAPKAEEPKAE
ncbi:flotillin family protein [Zongyangia hominis]|uniref:SPFH domain-containing protein n=1 Tax=Zongyangia hominis TaxID=2763677 RepID=A0A926IBE0_9FIRM|nr:flotillin family protein [Zongyangia hominis]MBC8570015.1 SPFH domain-containing protein [Zongyangia hominis]